MKTIFIASIGGAPQVVTETLWALMNPHQLTEPALADRDPTAPSEIHLVTTGLVGRGFESIDHKKDVIESKIYELYDQYKHPSPVIKFYIVEGDNKEPLEDIRTLNDNAKYADLATTIVSSCIKEEELDKIKIHMSLAGGRKTMSSIFQSIIMTFGRIDDEISHVLINQKLESCLGFWWPDQKDGPDQINGKVKNFNGKDVETCQEFAQLTLSLIPFIPLGEFFPEIQSIKEFSNYNKLIEDRKRALTQEMLVVDRFSKTISIGDESLRLEAKPFAFYATMAIAAKRRWKGFGPHGRGDGHYGWIGRDELRFDGKIANTFVRKIYILLIAGGNEANVSDSQGLIYELNQIANEYRKRGNEAQGDPFTSARSNLPKLIAERFENRFLQHDIQPAQHSKGRGKKADIRFGLLLPPHRIRLIGLSNEELSLLPDYGF